jgi:flagellar protein FlaG
MGNNVVPQQPATESADVKRSGSSDSVTEISSATPVQDVKQVEQRQSVANVNADAQKEAEGEELQSAVVELNKAVQNIQRNLEFSVDDITGQTVVKVIDKETDKIIRQMPSEEVLRLAQHMREQQPEGSDSISLMQGLKA